MQKYLEEEETLNKIKTEKNDLLDLLKTEITALYQYASRDVYSLDVIYTMILQLKDLLDKQQQENIAFLEKLTAEEAEKVSPSTQPHVFTDDELEMELDKMELSWQNTDLINEKAALITAITLLKEKLSMAQEHNTDLLKEQYRMKNKIAELKQKLGE